MPTDNFGSAHWANMDDLRKEGIIAFPWDRLPKMRSNNDRAAYLKRNPGNGSFILGRTCVPDEMLASVRTIERTHSRRQHQEPLLGWVGDGHISTFAPTRSGKGVGLVIPNLLHYPGSVIVVDPKGENYAVTSRFRREMLGQEVICLDPFGMQEKNTDAVNPMDGLVDFRHRPETYRKTHPELTDDISLIADAMIIREKGEKDQHWNDKARTLLKGILLAVVCGLGKGSQRHLGEVRNLLVQTPDDFHFMLLDWEFRKNLAGGLLSSASAEIQSMGGEELRSVVSVALKHTEFLDSPHAVRCLGGGDALSYDMRKLKTEGNVSIYIILPPHHMSRYSRLIRLWIHCAMAAMTRTLEKPADGLPVLFMLDEMAQLGRMEPLLQAVSLMAGYGMCMWMIWQDLAQVKSLYEHEWSSFVANAKIQQFFGVNDHETAKMVSEMLGEQTLLNASHSVSSGRSKESYAILKSTKTMGETISESEVARHLLKPDEVRRLDRESLIMFVQGAAPMLVKRLTYYRDMEFSGIFDKNPGI